MENEKDTTETTRIPMQTRVEPALHSAVQALATAADRSLSNTIERLLKTHPLVKPLMEPNEAGVTL